MFTKQCFSLAKGHNYGATFVNQTHNWISDGTARFLARKKRMTCIFSMVKSFSKSLELQDEYVKYCRCFKFLNHSILSQTLELSVFPKYLWGSLHRVVDNVRNNNILCRYVPFRTNAPWERYDPSLSTIAMGYTVPLLFFNKDDFSIW